VSWWRFHERTVDRARQSCAFGWWGCSRPTRPIYICSFAGTTRHYGPLALFRQLWRMALERFHNATGAVVRLLIFGEVALFSIGDAHLHKARTSASDEAAGAPPLSRSSCPGTGNQIAHGVPEAFREHTRSGASIVLILVSRRLPWQIANALSSGRLASLPQRTSAFARDARSWCRLRCAIR
jgi:hypothetical protein